MHLFRERGSLGRFVFSLPVVGVMYRTVIDENSVEGIVVGFFAIIYFLREE